MGDANSFNTWAQEYDQDVIKSDQEESFPFSGYRQVLDRIASLVLARQPGRLLDIGTGTGILAGRFYQSGWQVTAVDFSEEMLNQARLRMPDAEFILGDFSAGLADRMAGRCFDFIVMTYALHHLRYKEQTDFLRSLVPLLKNEGKILIGDIAFETQSDLEICQKRFLGDWDEEEFYPILSDINGNLPGLKTDYEVISFCAGVIQISNPTVR